jgi:hypothetical protein
MRSRQTPARLDLAPAALPLGAVRCLATTPSHTAPCPTPQPERVGRDPASRSTGTLFQWGREASMWCFAASRTCGNGPGSGEVVPAWLVAQPVPLLVERAGRGAGAGEVFGVESACCLPSVRPRPAPPPLSSATPRLPPQPPGVALRPPAPDPVRRRVGCAPVPGSPQGEGERQGQDEALVERGSRHGAPRRRTRRAGLFSPARRPESWLFTYFRQ